MTATLPYLHAAAGFEVPVPEGWERAQDVDGVALIAVEPERAEPHLRANVVVTVEAAIGDDWMDASVAALTESLNRLRIIDEEELAGGARRVLTHYLHPAFGGVNLEQRLVAAGDRGYVVSISVAALEFDDLWDLVSEIGDGFRAGVE